MSKIPLPLTSDDGDRFDRLYAQTYAGQAHLAEGPQMCASCRHFLPDKRPGYGACLKYRAMAGRRGAVFPRDALACKHYAHAPNFTNLNPLEER